MEKYYISTDKSLLQLNVIYEFLRKSYWAENIPIEIVKKSIDHSICFGVYESDRQIGFARVISDMATFAYLADVFILEENQGKGLSKLLMTTIMSHPELQHLRRWMLGTKDAHGVYEPFGFHALKMSERMMEISRPKIYVETK